MTAQVLGLLPLMWETGMEFQPWLLQLKIYLFVYLFERQRRGDKSCICCNGLHFAGLIPEAGAFIQVSPSDDSDPDTWAVFHCFFQVISRELEREWNSRDTNHCPKGMLMLWWWLHLLCINSQFPINKSLFVYLLT